MRLLPIVTAADVERRVLVMGPRVAYFDGSKNVKRGGPGVLKSVGTAGFRVLLDGDVAESYMGGMGRSQLVFSS